jgi:hypothetical protein
VCTSDDDAREGEGEGEGEGECSGPVANALTVQLTANDAPLCEGRVLFSVDGTAAAPFELPFDPDACAFTGPPTPVAGPVTIVADAFAYEVTMRGVDLCAPIAVTLPMVASPNACRADDACLDSFVCAIDRDTVTASCRENVGLPVGASCSDDDECASFFCSDGVEPGAPAECSRPCAIDMDCASLQACVADPDLLGAKVCVSDPALPDIACTANAECAPTGRQCSDVRNGVLHCGRARAGVDPIYTPGCTQLESDTCADGLCAPVFADANDGSTGYCTRACADDAACDASGGANAVCAFDPDTTLTLCTLTCTTSACDVVPGAVCRARADFDRDETLFVCDEPRGPRALGEPLAAGEDAGACASNFAIDGVGGLHCSAPCTANTDCPGAATCAQIALTRPNGGTQVVDACLFE